MKKIMSRKTVLAPQLSIGLDLGAEEAHACVVGRDGQVVEQCSFAVTPEEVKRLFEKRTRATIVIEACNISGWVSRLLEGLGHDVLTCNPRRLKIIAESTLKTDKLDAEVLGRLARLAQLDPEFVHPVTVRSRSTQLLRSELKGRDQLVATRTRLVNFVRSVLRADALPVPRCDADHFAAKIDLEALPPDVRPVIEPVLGVIRLVTEQLNKAPKRLHAIAAVLPGVERMVAIDGVGELTAVAFALCIEDPARFEHGRDVGPYLGLVPKLRQSASVEQRGRITKQGDTTMRRLLVQAALCLLRSKRDSALKQWALQVAERRGRKKAIVGLARKLGVVMHQVWVTGEEYRRFPSQVESLAMV